MGAHILVRVRLPPGTCDVVGTTIRHYRIGERLGAGGMGEVFLGEDIRLGRPVALKFLPPALKSDPESRARLLNEARAASLLNSPNIATTYDIGEHEGADFIVMEYVVGELLSSRLSKGALPVRDAIDVAIQIGDALDDAHAHGIVHRDIKSGNIIRTARGLVKVLDFGLAKFMPGGSADITRPQVTMAGMVVGTVSYMAPEQALGRSVDHRADLFSMGIVLYEMLTGRVPFEGTSPTEIIDRILHETPPPVSRVTSGVPASLDAVVARALEKDPAFRYQSARELKADLRRVAAELDGATQGTLARAAALAGPDGCACAVAVMTFVNITREPADDWIGTGIAESVSADLQKIKGLSVIGRARVYDAMRNLATDAHLNDALAIDIGRRLGATWVVVGGFQRMGSQIRITANFVEVASGDLRRTVKLDGRVDEIFSLQDRIVFELTDGLHLALRGSEVASIERRETRSVQAFESYARGMMNLRQATRESLDRAVAAFEDALRHDPEYARAWAALGGALELKGAFLTLPDLLHRAIEMVERALALDPRLADAYLWKGAALLALDRVDEAIEAIEDAIRIDPNSGQAHQGLARAYWVGKGDFAAAIPVFERAIELNPEAGYSYLQLALLLAYEEQYERAIDICKRAIDLQEQFISGDAGLQIVGAHSRLGYVYYLMGRHDEALREYERELAFIGSGDHVLRERSLIELNVKVGAVYLAQGRAADAERHFSRALRSFDSRVASGADDPFTRYYIACLHALRSDTERALDSLERVARTNPRLTAARARRDHDLRSLAAEPRFRALIGL
jgi:eukaryotic-like serine/threonine-protein kinase